jgi:hypothetical protein
MNMREGFWLGLHPYFRANSFIVFFYVLGFACKDFSHLSPLTESVRGCAGYAGSDDAVADGVELCGGSLAQTVVGGLAVNGVDHHLLRPDVADGL